MYQYILFDLDGTLTNSFEGITKSVRYALKHMGIIEESLEKLTCFIGPPLMESFMSQYHMNKEEAKQAITFYREYFVAQGIFENQPYQGIKELLKELRERHKILAVASSKPEVFVRKILDYFELSQYFEVIVGANLDETRTTKEEVLEEALRQCNKRYQEDLNHQNTIMVGDRKYDINAANVYKIASAAVTYGFAMPLELEECSYTILAHSVEELKEKLLES